MPICRQNCGYLFHHQEDNKRHRKWFKTRQEAERYARWYLEYVLPGKPWLEKSGSYLKLSDLCQKWYDVHGSSLKDGAARLRKLQLICEAMGDPMAHEFDRDDFITYRMARLDAGASPNTVNHDHAYLQAVFSELRRLGYWKLDNPMTRIRKLKVHQARLCYLNQDQIRSLLDECKQSWNTSLYYVVKLALATGARWSEAESVQPEDFTPYRVTFHGENTKSSKSRSVPMDRDTWAEIRSQAPFDPCYEAFRKAIHRAGIRLPKGQLTHVCRHTFAAHYLMNGGQIMALQQLLGHSDVKVTMRYAHFSPDYLSDAAALNPISKLA
jgi:integrase